MSKAVFAITILVCAVFNACVPLREFGNSPAYSGVNSFDYETPVYDSLKKTVIIVANNDGTELFDMIAPYYLFNATEQANVYIVAKNKIPIVAKKGVYLLPQSTFSEIDSLKIRPDVIVIPFLSVADSIQQDIVILNWIRNHYAADVNILSVCDGAATAAATGIFDGRPITAHASDYKGIKANFSKPLWVQNTSVASHGNLFSTAGVSNAVEGSLIVINKIFGPTVMKKVIDDIRYPLLVPETQHQSNTFHFDDKIAVGKKIILRKNKKIGVMLQNGMDEFQLAAIMDTYNRTFPKSIKSYSANDLFVRTKYGLTLIPTGLVSKATIDELHLIANPSASNQLPFKDVDVVTHDGYRKQYIFDDCLEKIRLQYGSKFENTVKLMLDYN